MTGWPALLARIERGRRQRRIAAAILRLLRFDEVEVVPTGEYSVAFGYVTLWNDVAPVVAELRAHRRGHVSIEDVFAALERFDGARDVRP